MHSNVSIKPRFCSVLYINFRSMFWAFCASVHAYFHSSFVPCICSRLPFHAAVPDKVFSFQLCSMHLFQTSLPAAVPDKIFQFQLCSMHLFQTSGPYSCSRQRISVPGYTALNIHEIWPRLLWGKHIHLRAKMT